jgi:hypothetical protein
MPDKTKDEYRQRDDEMIHTRDDRMTTTPTTCDLCGEDDECCAYAHASTLRGLRRGHKGAWERRKTRLPDASWSTVPACHCPLHCHRWCGRGRGRRCAASPSVTSSRWWNESHSDGATRFGWWNVGKGINACCGVDQAHGRAKRVDVTFECDAAATEDRAFRDVCAAVEARLGAPSTRSKNKRDVLWEGVAGAFKGDVIVKRAGSSSEFSRVELELSLAMGEEIKADERALFVDVDALADVLQSPAWPKERAKSALTAWFRHEYPGQASDDERKAIWSLHDDARGAHADDLQAVVERVVALADLSDFSRDSRRTTFLLDGLVNHVGQSAYPRTWVGLALRDVWPWFALLAVPADERPTWLRVLVSGLAFGDTAALAQLAARLQQHPPTSPLLPFASADDVVARCYGLLSAHLADDAARLLWVKDANHDAARAAVRFFASRGLVVDAVDWDAHAYYASAWGPWLMVAKRHFAPHLDDAVAVFVDRGGFDQRGWRAVLNEIADEKELGAKSSWRVGGWLFTHSGKERAGRWTAKLAASTTTKKATTKKKAATKQR